MAESEAQITIFQPLIAQHWATGTFCIQDYNLSQKLIVLNLLHFFRKLSVWRVNKFQYKNKICWQQLYKRYNNMTESDYAFWRRSTRRWCNKLLDQTVIKTNLLDKINSVAMWQLSTSVSSLDSPWPTVPFIHVTIKLTRLRLVSF